MEIVACPRCNQKLRVPSDRGRITVTCGKCSHQFSHSGSARHSSPTAAAASTARSSPSKRLLWLGPLIFGVATAAGSAIYNAVQESRRPPIPTFNGYLAPPVGMPQAPTTNQPYHPYQNPQSEYVQCICGGDGACIICGGTGKQKRSNPFYTNGVCGVCNGSGKCTTCHGSGRTPRTYELN